MKWRPATVVFRSRKGRIGFQQRVNFLQITIPSRVVNLVAEGEAAASQCNQ
jgi:hypothetical protein